MSDEKRSTTQEMYVVSYMPYPNVIHNKMFYPTLEEAKLIRDDMNAQAQGLRIYKVYKVELTVLKEEIK